MKNKKGFTLVELLAVIVILAVLVLLAVPSVIKMMDNAKKNAFSTEAENIIKGATLAYADGLMNGGAKHCYSLNDLTNYVDKNLEGYNGSVGINPENNEYQIWLSDGNYIIDGSYKGEMNVVENETTPTPGSTCATTPSAANCRNESPTILPNVASLRIQNVSTQFKTAQKFKSAIYGLSTESHMMKDTEWGSVAYLTQSIYGRCPNNICTEVRVNNNSGYKTGYAAVTVPTTRYSKTSIITNQHGTDSSITKPYTDASTLGLASTTGNISGIYDMSGGSFEYVMAVFNNYSGRCNVANSGYNGEYSNPSESGCDASLLNKSDGENFPNTKYYTTYNSTNKSTACNSGICYGAALSETWGWYKDSIGFTSLLNAWSVRGGNYYYGIDAGVFNSYYTHGAASILFSFRVVISI